MRSRIKGQPYPLEHKLSMCCNHITEQASKARSVVTATTCLSSNQMNGFLMPYNQKSGWIKSSRSLFNQALLILSRMKSTCTILAQVRKRTCWKLPEAYYFPVTFQSLEVSPVTVRNEKQIMLFQSTRLQGNGEPTLQCNPSSPEPEPCSVQWSP